MAPIVAPGIGRFSVNGTYGGQPYTNVWDLGPAVATGPAPDRPTFMALAAARLWEIFAVEFASNFSEILDLTDIAYVDLDSAEGTVGTFTPSAPAGGLVTGQAMPGNVAVRFNKNSGGYTRGQRAGRLYMAGAIDSWTTTDPNLLVGAVVTILNEASIQLMSDFGTPIPNGDDSFSLVPKVIHTRRPTPDSDPVFVSATNVTGLGLQTRLASQRRRLTLS